MPQGRAHAAWKKCSPGGRSQLEMKLVRCHLRVSRVKEVLVQQTRWAAEADPHEPLGLGASGGSGGAGGSPQTISISTRAAERLTS